MIIHVFFLKQRIPYIFLVGKHFPQPGCLPFSSQRTKVAVLVQPPCHRIKGSAFCDPPENFLSNRAFHRIDLNAVLADLIAEHETPAHDFAFFKGLTDTPFHVFTNRPAFFLGIGCQDGQHELTVGAFAVDVLFLEEYVDAQVFELPHRFQQGDGVPGEPRNRLRDNHIDFPGPAVRQHSLEFLPAVLGAGDRFICIDPGVLPTGMALDEIAVVAHLR